MASLLVVVALGAGAAAAGCGEDDAARAPVGGLKLGVLVPLNGELDSFGKPGARAAALAARRVNAAAGDSGLRLTLVEEDSGSDAQLAEEAATKLIEEDGVSAIAGPWSSSEILATAENVTVPAGIPIVSPSATSPAITDLDDDGLVLRTAPSDAVQGQVLAQMVVEALGPTASVVTASRDDAYGAALVAEFRAAFEAAGGRVVRDVRYDPRSADLSGEAAEIAAGDPDGWMIIDYPASWARMGEALAATGSWDPARTFTGDGLKDAGLPAEAGAAATEGIRGTAPTSLGAPAGAAFQALWKEQENGARGTYDESSFDAVILIALAAAATGSSDPAAIAEGVPAVSGPPGEKYTFERLGEAIAAAAGGEEIDYEGASGPLDLDENGDPAAAAYGTWSYRGERLVETGDVFSFTGDR
jgi:branched-chain amino acid transport system substrate-binding protein